MMKNVKILDISYIRDDQGKIYPQCQCKDPKGRPLKGRFVVLRENGQVHVEIEYGHGVVHGLYRDYWSNGKLACEGKFHDGKQEGLWQFYDDDGAISEKVVFKAGKEISRTGSRDIPGIR